MIQRPPIERLCFEPQPSKNGRHLSPQSIYNALTLCTRRYTGTFTPTWVIDNVAKGATILIEFVDDEEWLDNTEFFVDDNGELDKDRLICYSIKVNI